MTPLRICSAATACAALVVACSDPNALAKPSVENQVDTLTLWALEGGPLQEPSAYTLSSGAAGQAVRVYETISFEFAFNIDGSGKPVLLPLAVLNLTSAGDLEPGLLPSTSTFDGITKAPRNGYITRDTIAADSGAVFVVRSRAVCSGLGVPEYGKIEILAVDIAQKTLTFRALANQNCGYRALTIGLPKE